MLSKGDCLVLLSSIKDIRKYLSSIDENDKIKEKIEKELQAMKKVLENDYNSN